MNIKRELGEKIRRARKSRGLTQEELAEKIDISSRNLSNIEVGANFPKSETLEKILKALNITTQELFENDYLRDSEALFADINEYLERVKDNRGKLEKIYKMIKFFVEED
ncbi:MAG: helix-turn-helix domain-containing protein [Fusobacterium sp.]|nr:helix-turn-helix domain-containing protein [Fusobacterium sp.]